MPYDRRIAPVAELVDAPDSKSGDGNIVLVRSRPGAPVFAATRLRLAIRSATLFSSVNRRSRHQPTLRRPATLCSGGRGCPVSLENEGMECHRAKIPGPKFLRGVGVPGRAGSLRVSPAPPGAPSRRHCRAPHPAPPSTPRSTTPSIEQGVTMISEVLRAGISARALSQEAEILREAVSNPLLPAADDPSRRHGRNLFHLFGDHLEARERARAERGQDRDVGGVAPARHQDAADARMLWRASNVYQRPPR